MHFSQNLVRDVEEGALKRFRSDAQDDATDARRVNDVVGR
jgi:hypothetical protein